MFDWFCNKCEEHTVFKDKTQEKHKFILGQKVGIQFPGNLTIIR